jgi:hypothetical protein
MASELVASEEPYQPPTVTSLGAIDEVTGGDTMSPIDT